ncbi:aromatic-ring-hydroxylating dioxygenase subunit beta [Pseudomonas fluorescens BRIP34879]|uniref:aromatic-ring-hydroxylating dioxygenase subunit beta n=1 Tax=Pseudomonas TaxID=286 RepID=UPI0002A78E42|nr:MULTISPECIES: aromatic-ring-hydroxylating dioxygenase subunit beta [Pseudomonas]ELQ18012.1 aromatic-ring-hydroxylating dioxygenase subunit beta [Pseudomonas fluorescens BRIP34879]QXH78010.1 aromatic-ring-hydroxylating dioxygenase subunit beta [Pseudomonas salmasensis]CRM33934.1 2-halobenzoate 1,2-dioxygenase small subunit [Pseudomonas sp. 52 E 6]CRM51657.1 2-halobenzoate 1,2-dioxygenase small subunit [Pseudomonas sp. 24 E 1]CRM62283.1 2-halobenzoate 1,2-dioxygenase small subunit [Pseudomona
MNLQLLQEVTAFIWQEGDMLDHGEYEGWLKMWTEKGTYIIPIDPRETDFENTLNYAYDDHHMRELRVQRLTGGESISTSPQPRTVRMQSRFRVLADDGTQVTVRCAQNIREFRKESLKFYSADLTYELIRSEGSFKIQRKVISLINSDDALAGIGYIL